MYRVILPGNPAMCINLICVLLTSRCILWLEDDHKMETFCVKNMWTSSIVLLMDVLFCRLFITMFYLKKAIIKMFCEKISIIKFKILLGTWPIIIGQSLSAFFLILIYISFNSNRVIIGKSTNVMVEIYFFQIIWPDLVRTVAYTRCTGFVNTISYLGIKAAAAYK